MYNLIDEFIIYIDGSGGEMTYDEFHKWAYREIGINLTAYKSDQLNRRIDSFMDKNGIGSLEDYTMIIKRDSEKRQKFIDFLTINVTEFYRNPELFVQLESIIERELLSARNNLKIWSAACSIGCEPYSVTMMLDKITPMQRHTIIATDIDSTILSKAKRGEYIDTEMKNVKLGDVQKYFKVEGSVYKISNDIISRVSFRKHDLILDRYEGDFDLILCRNVLIYFNNDVRKDIYRKFSESLKPGGLLFVGGVESIYNYVEYGLEKVSTYIYKKK